MEISQQDLKREVASFSQATLKNLYKITADHGGGVIGVPLLIGFASRETDCHNIEGDGGHGNGMFQEDDRYWADWLRHEPGCRNGTNTPVKGHNALEHGYVSTVEAGALKCILMYLASYHAALSHGYTKAQARKIAVSAYNAGLGGALNGQRQFGNPDHYTTGGNYADDTIARASAAYHILKLKAK